MKAVKHYTRHAPRRRTFHVDDPLSHQDYPTCGFKCKQCQQVKPRKDFVFRVMGDNDRLHCWCKHCRSTIPQPVADGYCRSAIRAGTSIPASAKIPKWLVELKRKQIQLRRMKNERKRA